jgi:hypothetical protein
MQKFFSPYWSLICWTNWSINSLDTLSQVSSQSLYQHFFSTTCNGIISVTLSQVSSQSLYQHFFSTTCNGIISVTSSQVSSQSLYQHFFYTTCNGIISVTLSQVSSQSLYQHFFYTRCNGIISITLSQVSSVRIISHKFCLTKQCIVWKQPRILRCIPLPWGWTAAAILLFIRSQGYEYLT